MKTSTRYTGTYLISSFSHQTLLKLPKWTSFKQKWHNKYTFVWLILYNGICTFFFKFKRKLPSEKGPKLYIDLLELLICHDILVQFMQTLRWINKLIWSTFIGTKKQQIFFASAASLCFGYFPFIPLYFRLTVIYLSLIPFRHCLYLFCCWCFFQKSSSLSRTIWFPSHLMFNFFV